MPANEDLPEDRTKGVSAGRVVMLPFPIIPNFSGGRDLRYYLPIRMQDTSHISTQWISIPEGPSEISYGATTTHYPSAFLLIQNPGLPHTQSDISCSIQADWVTGSNVASKLCFAAIKQTIEQGLIDQSIIDHTIGQFSDESNARE